tara:strand:+ start:5135 stop:5389 length:255 start_codon:yes stop_codon:yes gene_type:complete
MRSLIQNIEKKIKKNFDVSKIEIIDNSHKHQGHKFFQKGKFHLKIIIRSEDLKNLNKIDAHKKIMQVLRQELKDKIHALEIKIN